MLRVKVMITPESCYVVCEHVQGLRTVCRAWKVTTRVWKLWLRELSLYIYAIVMVTEVWVHSMELLSTWIANCISKTHFFFSHRFILGKEEYTWSFLQAEDRGQRLSITSWRVRDPRVKDKGQRLKNCVIQNSRWQDFSAKSQIGNFFFDCMATEPLSQQCRATVPRRGYGHWRSGKQ